MKRISKSLIAAAVVVAAISLVAQDASSPGEGAPRRPGSPLVAALDSNQDGVIDATEIANAPKALLTLDKNGDGQLTADELRPARGPGGQGPGGPGHRGPRPPADGQ
ncbi:MAG TPA: EF-hand domain-containing protein [Verrucomicrobiota bacterium]|nr:calcium-binding protein [Verrucomicrobiales bacterium]HRI13435.1 EF-hand domain-containing protein [Verrucomicrobiota bacterium]